NDDRADQAKIEAGRKLLVDSNRCANCHRYGDASMKPSGPDLAIIVEDRSKKRVTAGYGTLEWLIAFISDPSHERFYGKKNDRMPASAKNRLSHQEIVVLANWLRGDYDAAAEEK